MNRLACRVVALALAWAAGASAAANVQVVAVVQDFEGEGGGWTPTGDAAVGHSAGMTEQVFAGGWNGFMLRISEVPADADGISFWVRTGDEGSAAMTLGLYQWQEKEKTQKPVDAWGAHLWATPNWQKYTFPFSKLITTWNAEGDGKFRKERVKSIQWQRFIVEGRGLRSAQVVFDQIEFVKNADVATIGHKAGEKQIVVDASKPIGKVPRFWRAISPGDNIEHNPYFEGADGAAMRVVGADGTFDYARLCWAMFPKASPWLPYTYGGPIYTEDASGNPVYDWKGMDALVDNVLKCRLRPMMLLHTVPKEMAVDLRSGYGAYYCCPPKDYNKWRSLVRTYVQHYVDKYGKEEVAKWYWEIWNEPDLWWQTWKVKEKDAGADEYMRMYDYAAAGITDVLGDKALLGSPAIAGYPRDYSKRLLEHCTKAANSVTGKVASPLSILTHHCYGNPFEQMAKLYGAKQLLDAYAPERDIEIHVTEYAPSIWGRPFGMRYVASYLVDSTHSDVYSAWETAGSPAYNEITMEQVKQIKAHDSLEMSAPEDTVNVTRGATWSAKLVLDPNSVALFVLRAQ